jgi:PAS domain S-box-containing protein
VRLILTLCRDITERKRAEEKLQKSQARLRSILDATPFPIALVDLQDNNIHYWSRSAVALFGHTAPTAAQWYEMAYPDPEYRQEVIERWKPFLEKVRSSGQTVNTGEYRISCHDGSVRMCELYATFLAENLIVTFNDITERHQAESQLRESEEKFSKTFRLSPEMISISRLSDGTYYEVNEAFERIMGFTRQETIGRTSTEMGIWADPQDRARMVKALRERGGLHQFETKIFRKDRSIITALFSASPIEIRGEQYLLAIVMDITERIRAEQQREQLLKALQAKTEELESIIYVSSHDLRSPLVNIQGFSGELNESCRQVRKLLSGDTAPVSDHQQLEELLGQEIPSALEYITASVSKLDALQKGLLKICRIGHETLEIAPVAMNELIDGVLKSTRYQLDNAAAQVTVEPLPNCLADAAQLTQVFTNLIDNAIKYRGPDRPLQIRIYGRVENAHSVYAVADNGLGIASEHQQKVFEMFHQLDPLNGPGGEGLGLTIVKRILGRMDGQVRLESAVGVGSVFTVLLPKA